MNSQELERLRPIYAAAAAAAAMPVPPAEPAAAPADKRGQARSSMFLACVLRIGARQVPSRVRNMSSGGALVETPIVPPPGTSVFLGRGALFTEATVAWSGEGRCGLRFSNDVNVSAWLRAPAKAQQERVDQIVAMVKTGTAIGAGAAPATARTAREPRPLTLLVEDIGAVSGLLQHLEDELVSSDDTVARHGATLQNLDIGMQMLRAIAAELQSPGSDDLTGGGRLSDLRKVCAHAIGHG